MDRAPEKSSRSRATRLEELLPELKAINSRDLDYLRREHLLVSNLQPQAKSFRPENPELFSTVLQAGHWARSQNRDETANQVYF